MRLVPGLERGYSAALPGVWEAVVIRRKRKDPVTPEVARAVFARDQGCMAPRLGGSSLDCFGRRRIEHVQEGYGRTGVRAKSLVSRLVELCDGHTEPGMRRGYVWCTDKRNREAMREYLASVTPPNADPWQMDETA